MSVPMKERPIKTGNNIMHVVYNGNVYDIPRAIAEQYKVGRLKDNELRHPSEGAILADDLFAELDDKYTKPGVLLKGIRCRENLTQVEFAEKIEVTQSDLSKMESGKRPIGKILAKRIAEKFSVDYRMLIG